MKKNHPGTKRALSDDARLILGVGLWGMVKNALAAGLTDRGVKLPDEEVRFVTRFMLEHLEAKGQRIVPVKATLDMHEAMRVALDEGKRMSLKWVQGKPSSAGAIRRLWMLHLTGASGINKRRSAH